MYFSIALTVAELQKTTSHFKHFQGHKMHHLVLGNYLLLGITLTETVKTEVYVSALQIYLRKE